MKDRNIRLFLVLGTLTLISIVVLQSYWLIKSWHIKDQEFDISVNIALTNVALGVAKYNEAALPKTELISRRSSNIYAVNVNSKVDPMVLEDLLYQEFSRLTLLADFEYAVYDCETDHLAYGYYCQMAEQREVTKRTNLPKFEKMTYYFVVKFPSRQNYLISNIWTNALLAGLTILASLIFVFFIYVILRQRRLSELQREFINNMTHEFKTPISSIRLAANALGNQDGFDTNEKAKKYLSIINSQNDRLNDQIERVLQLAILENASEDYLQKQNIDLNPTTQSIVEEVAQKTTSHTIEYEASSDKTISGDLLHYTNVVYTLLDNAVKYSKPGSKVTVALKSEGDKTSLTISDQGIGISASDQKMIFQKFYRVATGDKHDVKGFGLGLYYVSSICRAHGWKIDVKSKLNEGTNFIITF